MTSDGNRLIEEMLGVPGAQAVAAAVGKQQRADASQQQRSRHDEQFDGGVDPAYVTSQEPPPEAMTHQQIWDDVQSLDQQSIWNACLIWSQVSTTITSTFQLARIGLNRAVEGRWEGQAADAGVAAMSAFATGGEHMGEVAKSVAMRLDTMFYAAQALAGAVPPPPVATVADPDNASESVLPWLISGEKARADDDNATRLRALAVAAVNTTYLPTFPPSGADVPSFVAPPQVGEGIDTGGNGAGAPTPGGAQSPTAPGSADPGTGAPTDDQPSATSPESTGATSEGDAGTSEQAGSTESGADSDTATTAAGAAPTTATPSAGTPPNVNGQSPVGGVPGSGGGAPGSGGGLPGSGGGGPSVGVGQPVRGSVPGVGAAASASTAGSSAGRSGHGPMGPMAPGAGARKGQGDEDTHQSPDYLRRVQEELVGHQSAISPVIGDHTTEISASAPESRPEPLPTPAADLALPRSLFSADDRPHQQPAQASAPSTTAVSVPTAPPAAAEPTAMVSAAATPTPAPGGSAPEPTGDVLDSAQTQAPAAQPRYEPIAGSGPWDTHNPATEPDAQREDQPPATDSGGRP
ncbi:hypothetical protein ACTWPB_08065 [Nocardia sp. IBHARD005]|uniref:hypothetical protein n=1 Tax=Nocardia sp. IBHARD005 TaxID=3457765 RepID=UPI0040591484